jgi:hypothetical protein
MRIQIIYPEEIKPEIRSLEYPVIVKATHEINHYYLMTRNFEQIFLISLQDGKAIVFGLQQAQHALDEKYWVVVGADLIIKP